jgi:translation initiation factor 4E
MNDEIDICSYATNYFVTMSWISPPILSFNRKLASAGGANETLFALSPRPLSEDKLELKYSWVLWEQNRQSESGEVGSSAYGDLTRNIATLSTVQEFWSIFNTLPQPSELLSARDSTQDENNNQHIGSFMLFKQGVRPEWEDQANKSGGHFQFTLQTDKFRNVTKENSSIKDADILAIIDEYWNNLVLALIGNTLPLIHDVTGIRLVDKTRHGKGGRPQGHVRIELWFTQTHKVDSLREAVEKALKTRPQGELAVDFIPGFRLDTRFHDDSSMQQCTAELLAQKKRFTAQVVG